MGNLIKFRQRRDFILCKKNYWRFYVKSWRYDDFRAKNIRYWKWNATSWRNVKAGAYVSEENSDGDTTTSNETNVNFEVKTYVNFLYGNDVQMNFPSFDDYKVLTTQK